MWQRFILILLAASSLPAAGPLAAQDRASSAQPARAKTAPAAVAAVELVTVTADNGNRLSFLEPEEGVVLIVEEGQYPNDSVLDRADIRDQDSPVAIYRALQPRRAVPARLQQAEAKMVVSSATSPEDPEEAPVVRAGAQLPAAVVAVPATPAQPTRIRAQPARPAPAQGESQAPLKPEQHKALPAEPGKQGQQASEEKPGKPATDTRAGWFQDEFCPGVGGTSYSWCWLDRTGSSTQQRWSFSMAPVVYSCGGTVRLKFQYKRFGKWKDYVSRDVLPGYYYRASRYGIWRTRRARVIDADGDCYHFAGAGIR